jgi:hypothetical protein
VSKIKHHLLFACSIFLVATSAAVPRDISRQLVHLGPHLKVTVLIAYNVNTHWPQVDAAFETDDPKAYDVNCLSVYKDLKYVLLDRSGRVMTIDQDAWRTHLDTTTENYTQYKCQNLPPSQEKESYAYLKDLYPDAAAGRYSLQITVAPRNLDQTVTLAPVEVQL